MFLLNRMNNRNKHRLLLIFGLARSQFFGQVRFSREPRTDDMIVRKILVEPGTRFVDGQAVVKLTLISKQNDLELAEFGQEWGGSVALGPGIGVPGASVPNMTVFVGSIIRALELALP